MDATKGAVSTQRTLMVGAAGLLAISVVLVPFGPQPLLLLIPLTGVLVAGIASRARFSTNWSEKSRSVASIAGLSFIALASWLAALLIVIPFAPGDSRPAQITSALSVTVGMGALLTFVAKRAWAWAWAAALVVMVPGVVAVLSLEPGIDVLMFERGAVDALLRGLNPYDITFSSPYDTAHTIQFYGPEVREGTTLLFGFPYPPVVLLLGIPGQVLGDFRLSLLALHIVASIVLFRSSRDDMGRALSLLFLVAPETFRMFLTGWTESLSASLLALTVCALANQSRWTSVALGLFAASKQYTVLFAPLVALLRPPTTHSPTSWWKTLGSALAIGMVVSVPFVLWGPHEFFNSVGALQFHQPWRADSFSLLVWWGENVGAVPRVVQTMLPLGAALATSTFLGWRGQRAPWAFSAAIGVTLGVMVLLAKQAFTNYYFLVLAAFLIAAIVFPLASNEPTPNGPTRTDTTGR